MTSPGLPWSRAYRTAARRSSTATHGVRLSAAPESTSSAGQASGNGTSGGAGFALPLLAAGGAALLIAALLVLRARRRS